MSTESSRRGSDKDILLFFYSATQSSEQVIRNEWCVVSMSAAESETCVHFWLDMSQPRRTLNLFHITHLHLDFDSLSIVNNHKRRTSPCPTSVKRVDSVNTCIHVQATRQHFRFMVTPLAKAAPLPDIGESDSRCQ